MVGFVKLCKYFSKKNVPKSYALVGKILDIYHYDNHKINI